MRTKRGDDPFFCLLFKTDRGSYWIRNLVSLLLPLDLSILLYGQQNWLLPDCKRTLRYSFKYMIHLYFVVSHFSPLKVYKQHSAIKKSVLVIKNKMLKYPIYVINQTLCYYTCYSTLQACFYQWSLRCFYSLIGVHLCLSEPHGNNDVKAHSSPCKVSKWW